MNTIEKHNVEWLKKQAKRLTKAVHAGDAAAIGRYTKVYGRGEAFYPEDFGHMQALHIIAVEHGHRSWAALLEANR